MKPTKLKRDRRSGLLLPSVPPAQTKAIGAALKAAIKKAGKDKLPAKAGRAWLTAAAQALASAARRDVVTAQDVGLALNTLQVEDFDLDRGADKLRRDNARAFEVLSAIMAGGDPSEFSTENITPGGTRCKRVTVCYADEVSDTGKIKTRRVSSKDLADYRPKPWTPEGATAPAGFLGLPCPLLTPGGQGIKSWSCRYVLAERAAVKPSHTTRFQPTPGYPAEMQERDYSRDENEQQRIQRAALDWRPAMVLNDDPTSQSGPPIIDRKGRVVGGNSRMITINTLCEDPRTAVKYAAALRAALENHAMDWGLSSLSDSPDLSAYVVVRMISDEFDTRTISAQLNQGWTNALNVSGESVSCGRALPPDLIALLADRMREADTVEQALEGAAGRQAVQMLQRAGTITPQTQARWLRYARGQYLQDLSRQGMDAVRRCLVGAVIDSQDVLAHATPSTAALFERLAPAWLSIFARVPEWRAPFQLAASELVEVLDYSPGQRHHRFAQGSLFGDGGGGEAILRDPVAVSLLVWLYCMRATPKQAAERSAALMRALGKPSGGLFSPDEGLEDSPDDMLSRYLGAPHPADIEDRGALPVLTRLEQPEACAAPQPRQRRAPAVPPASAPPPAPLPPPVPPVAPMPAPAPMLAAPVAPMPAPMPSRAAAPLYGWRSTASERTARPPITIEKEEGMRGAVAVRFPYNPDLIREVKELGCTFDSANKRWRCPKQNEDKVRLWAVETFGGDGSAPVPVVNVRFKVGRHAATQQAVYRFGRLIVERRAKKSPVRYGEGVYAITSYFGDYGGSEKNPAVEGADSVLVIRDVPLSLVQKAREKAPNTYSIEDEDQ